MFYTESNVIKDPVLQCVDRITRLDWFWYAPHFPAWWFDGAKDNRRPRMASYVALAPSRNKQIASGKRSRRSRKSQLYNIFYIVILLLSASDLNLNIKRLC
jgi:hypothetical protein